MCALSHFGWEPQSAKRLQMEKVNYHNATFLAVVKGIEDMETLSKNKNTHVLSQQLFSRVIYIKLCERSARTWPLDALCDDSVFTHDHTKSQKAASVWFKPH